MNELHKTLRPTDFSQVIGQPSAVAQLKGYLKTQVPHALMFVGEPGVGKTSLARIMRRKLKCGKRDYNEINCARLDSPLAAVNRIEDQAHMCPTDGPVRVWVLDEVQALSRATFAQQGLLKLLEEPPEHAYFILCTTDPERVLKAIRSRCKIIHLPPLKRDDMELLLVEARIKTGGSASCSDKVLGTIIDSANGSPRQALVLLESVLLFDNEKQQLRALRQSDSKTPAINICRALMQRSPSWSDVGRMIKNCDTESEGLRIAIIRYAESVLLGGGKLANRCAMIIDALRDQCFERAVLACCCYGLVADINGSKSR